MCLVSIKGKMVKRDITSKLAITRLGSSSSTFLANENEPFKVYLLVVIGSIFSAIGTSTYKLPKFCYKLLKPITTNEYTIKDSLSFAKEIE